MPRQIIFDIEEVKKLRRKKMTLSDIGKKLGVTRQRIHQILKEEKHG